MQIDRSDVVPENNNSAVNGLGESATPGCNRGTPVIKGALHPCTWARPGADTPAVLTLYWRSDAGRTRTHHTKYQPYFISGCREKAMENMRTAATLQHSATHCSSHSSLGAKIPPCSFANRVDWSKFICMEKSGRLYIARNREKFKLGHIWAGVQNCVRALYDGNPLSSLSNFKWSKIGKYVDLGWILQDELQCDTILFWNKKAPGYMALVLK